MPIAFTTDPSRELTTLTAAGGITDDAESTGIHAEIFFGR